MELNQELCCLQLDEFEYGNNQQSTVILLQVIKELHGKKLSVQISTAVLLWKIGGGGVFLIACPKSVVSFI
jgi:hypothetical protein